MGMGLPVGEANQELLECVGKVIAVEFGVAEELAAGLALDVLLGWVIELTGVVA